MLDLSHDLKAKKRAGVVNYLLKGKNVVLLFEKTSTRTRCAFEVGALEEGAHVTYLDQNSSQIIPRMTRSALPAASVPTPAPAVSG